MPRYSIEARSLSIVGGTASHDFWVLRDENGKALAELHGLATDRKTNEFVPVGTDENRHSLRVWHFPHDPAYAKSHGETATSDSFIREGQAHRTVLAADSKEVLARWNSAVNAVDKLNALDLDYPNYGFKVFGETINSNSTYNTLGQIMGVPVKDFPGRLEPGIDNLMLPKAEVDKLRTHGFPVLEEPRIDPATRKLDASLNHTDQALLEKIRTSVLGLDRQTGKGWDESSDRLSASLLVAAKEKGWSGEDRISMAFSLDTERAAAGQYVHMARTGGNASGDPFLNRASVLTDEARAKPVEQSHQQMQTLAQQQELEQQQALARGPDDPSRGGPTR